MFPSHDPGGQAPLVGQLSQNILDGLNNQDNSRTDLSQLQKAVESGNTEGVLPFLQKQIKGLQEGGLAGQSQLQDPENFSEMEKLRKSLTFGLGDAVDPVTGEKLAGGAGGTAGAIQAILLGQTPGREEMVGLIESLQKMGAGGNAEAKRIADDISKGSVDRQIKGGQ